MFKRLRKGQSVAGSVAFDPWCGDPGAPDLREGLEAGDTGPFATAYEEADAHRREFLAQTLILDLPQVAVLDSWPEVEPGSALAFLSRGIQGINAAWEVRGSGYAETVGEQAWDVFFER